jgi:hypothetical protein
VRLSQILAGGLVLDKQPARPKQVNESPIAGEFFYRLLECSDRTTADAEDVEEFVPEGLALGGFAGFTLPVFAEGDGAVANFVPRERHAGEV